MMVFLCKCKYFFKIKSNSNKHNLNLHFNLVAMNKKFNGSGGDWGTFETTLKKAKNRKQDVIVNIKPVYSGTSKRPDRFDVEYSIDGGSPQEATLYNQE